MRFSSVAALRLAGIPEEAHRRSIALIARGPTVPCRRSRVRRCSAVTGSDSQVSASATAWAGTPCVLPNSTDSSALAFDSGTRSTQTSPRRCMTSRGSHGRAFHPVVRLGGSLASRTAMYPVSPFLPPGRSLGTGFRWRFRTCVHLAVSHGSHSEVMRLPVQAGAAHAVRGGSGSPCTGPQPGMVAPRLWRCSRRPARTPRREMKTNGALPRYRLSERRRGAGSAEPQRMGAPAYGCALGQVPGSRRGGPGGRSGPEIARLDALSGVDLHRRANDGGVKPGEFLHHSDRQWRPSGTQGTERDALGTRTGALHPGARS